MRSGIHDMAHDFGGEAKLPKEPYLQLTSCKTEVAEAIGKVAIGLPQINGSAILLLTRCGCTARSEVDRDH